ncbi:Glycosyltransferase involved in cell wall bisynthesis [Belliella buryatensis]|uniref:Glycosyltransferase involved in cell wall bisynthesis n=1 Tax=Belliella buryatensis TaxID=1500549 RepID=A0A239EDF7_9BACT|nr:glycosyltransferase family 1 protein [Belliella buryatensis]SNS41922.1 Glycosyltransferase involved in cell wall bisynthesis [Belliella buryatensis]
MGKIRVGFDSRDLFFAQTGTKTFSEELIKEIQQDPTVELVLLSPKNAKAPSSLWSKALAHFQFIIWKLWTLPRKAQQAKVDYLICPDYVAPFLFLGKVKTLPVFHGCNIWEIPQNYNTIWRWYFSALARGGEKKAHRVLTVSQFSKSKLIDVLGIADSKIKVIPIGAKAIQNSVNNATQRPIKNEYLLHIGVLDKRKNLPRLIRAFALLDDSSIHLILGGGRPSKIFNDSYPEIQATIKELGLEKRVHLTGYLKDEMLAHYYQHAKAYVFPSTYEGFGIPVLEAFQHGLPLAASNISSLPEVVGEGGLLFDPYNIQEMAYQIEALFSMGESELSTMKEKQEKLLSWYNWSNSWKEIKQTLNEK